MTNHDHLLMETPDFLSTDGILSQFASNRPKAQIHCHRFTRAGNKEASPWIALEGPCLPVGKEFIEKLSPYFKQKATIRGIRLIDRKTLRPELAPLSSEANLASKALPNRSMHTAHCEQGFRQKEIAEHLGLHDTTVSNILRKIR